MFIEFFYLDDFLKLGKYNGYDNALRIYRSVIDQAKPDVTFILTANSSEKLKRNLNRGKVLKNNCVKNDLEFYDIMALRLKKCLLT